MKPTLFPLLPLPGEVPPVRCRRCKGCCPPKARCERRRKLNYRLKRTPVRDILHHILGDVGESGIRCGIDDRSRGVHFNHG